MSPSQAERPVFAIVISEKGGAERREIFDRPEISVGRVQGNDLMLPKGNVSKRHARLLFRDGRFIVTDLNSTNGTYVNRRRISQATIVREGDRIYVGDFVLRIELPDGGGDPAQGTDRNLAGGGGTPRAQASSADHIAAGASEDGEEPSVVGPLPASVPPPPGLSRPPPPRPAPKILPAMREVGGSGPHPPKETSRPSLPLPVRSKPPTVADPDARARRTSLGKVVEGVMASLEPGALDASSEGTNPRIARLVEEQVAALRSSGGIAPGLAERVELDAKAELTGTGPLAELMEDDSVSDIVVSRWDRIAVVREGRVTPVEPAFSSERALARALVRLCARSGAALEDGESVIERRLPDGSMLWAAIGPAAIGSAALHIKKPQRTCPTLDELVRGGVLSRGIASFLQQCAMARVNLLVVGPRDSGTSAVVSAICTAAPDENLVVIEDNDEIVGGIDRATRLSVAGLGYERARLVQMAARIPKARLVVELAGHDVTEAALEAVAAGGQGVVGVARASSLRRALARLPADVLAVRPGMSAAAAREIVASAFDVAVEIGRLRDGRCRVLRVSELGGVAGEDFLTQEIFSFVVERSSPNGALEGAFNPSGTTPHIVEDMQARGVPVDMSVFSRNSLR